MSRNRAQKFCRFQNPTKRALIYESDIMRSCYEKTGIPPAFRSRVMKKTLNGAVERRGVTIEPDCEKADERPFRILLFARQRAFAIWGFEQFRVLLSTGCSLRYFTIVRSVACGWI